jgi:hypothetical protein
MNLKLPFLVLQWIDDNRGGKTRKAFIVDCLVMLVKENRKP